MKCVLFVGIISRLAHGAQVDLVPGYGRPPTKHFSGFVEVDPSSGTNLFYYLVESQNDPKSDPLLWWMNGGPGASSLVGLFAESGPMLLNEANQIIDNPYAWNRRANVLFVEFGPGVGYSYCNNSFKTDIECLQTRDDCSPCSASDTTVFYHNYIFLKKFLTVEHPELAGRPLFLAGEGYAGVYIPTLARALLDRFVDTSVANLHGLWVTDPCTDNKAQYGWLDIGVEFSYQKGLISADTYQTITKGGCMSGRTAVGDLVRLTDAPACKKAWRLYDIATAGIGNAVHPKPVPGLPMYIDPLSAYGPSGGADIPGYLSRQDVREAFHATASPNKKYHLELGNNGYLNYKMEYSACNDKAKPGTNSMLDIYRTLIQAKSDHLTARNLKHIIMSSGDIDPVVNLHGTERAVQEVGLSVLSGGDRRPWFYNDTATSLKTLASKPVQWGPMLRALDAGPQIGGFVTDYNTTVSGLSFQFVSMRASGHMVPQYVPHSAFHVILNALLQSKPLAPLLPNDWETSSDDEFYGWKNKNGGAFTAWVDQAMSSVFIEDDGASHAQGNPQVPLIQI